MSDRRHDQVFVYDFGEDLHQGADLRRDFVMPDVNPGAGFQVVQLFKLGPVDVGTDPDQDAFDRVAPRQLVRR